MEIRQRFGPGAFRMEPADLRNECLRAAALCDRLDEVMVPLYGASVGVLREQKQELKAMVGIAKELQDQQGRPYDFAGFALHIVQTAKGIDPASVSGGELAAVNAIHELLALVVSGSNMEGLTAQAARKSVEQMTRAMGLAKAMLDEDIVNKLRNGLKAMAEEIPVTG